MASEPPMSSRAASKKASTSATTVEEDPASQRFVIGKIDAGIAVLISDSVHLIEFPSLLLPAGVGPGSIVNIACSRNFAAEREATKSFWDLQNDIFAEFGAEEPQPPNLRIRNTTQTSVTLEWDKLQLAKAKLLGLSIWRNGQRLTTIPNPLSNTSTKLSGLALDTDYTFHLVLKTSAGTLSSTIVKTRTHTITDTSGISVCFGHIEPESLLTEAKAALGSMKARFYDKIQIDTTHFVATSPASPSNPSGGPGVEYQKALQLSIPVVSPEWVIACNREHKMVPISNYYIGHVNNAASLSSAQLVTSNGQIPAAKPARRATASTIEEEREAPGTSTSSVPIPAVVPAPSHIPASELAEEDPEGPPAEEAVPAPVDVVAPEVPAPVEPESTREVVPESQAEEPLPEVEAPEQPVVVEHPEIIVEAPKVEEQPEIVVEAPREDVAELEPAAPETPEVVVSAPTPTFSFTAPEEDNVAATVAEVEPTPEVEAEPESAVEADAEEEQPEELVPEIVISPSVPGGAAQEDSEDSPFETVEPAGEEKDVGEEADVESDARDEGNESTIAQASETPLVDFEEDEVTDEKAEEKEEDKVAVKAGESMEDVGL